MSLFLSIASSEGSDKSAQVWIFAKDITACTFKVGILMKTYSLRPDFIILVEYVCIKNAIGTKISLAHSNSLFLLQVMVTNVTSLLKTVKSVEDEATRGTRALESTIEAIGQEVKVCNKPHELLHRMVRNHHTIHGLVARKPVFGVSVKPRFKPVFSATETI